MICDSTGEVVFLTLRVVDGVFSSTGMVELEVLMWAFEIADKLVWKRLF